MAYNIDWSQFNQTTNWNSAKTYSDFKLMKHMIEIDSLVEIAKFGSVEIIEDFILDEQTKVKARINAIKRLASKLYLILSNTKFALKSKEAKESFKNFQDIIKKVEADYIEKKYIYKDTKSINGSVKVIILEDKFKKILEILEGIKEDMLDPLNKAELIFRTFEEFDPDELKRKITEDIINAG